MELSAKLDGLAKNLWWSWVPEGPALWHDLIGDDWTENNSNPVPFLERCKASAGDDQALAKRVDALYASLQDYLGSTETWFSASGLKFDGPVAYFCSEFGLHESLAIYSGGLGVLAGDHLKSASDLGLPLVGVGLLYRRGYVRQEVDATGWQQSQFPEYDFSELPISLVTDPSGQAIEINVPIEGRGCICQIWQVNVGRCTLYLMDADLPSNAGDLRELTAQLYGGDNEMRIRQELLLGVGGIRTLDAVGVSPSVYHLNEGHSAFSGLERAAQLMAKSPDLTLAQAADQVSQNAVFTTHTPVEAGHDRFSPDLALRYLGWMQDALRTSPEGLLALGRWPGDSSPNAEFNMTLCALSASKWVNGVAKLHGEVSREMFARFWPGKPVDDVPIGHVTNGVHHRTWQAPEMQALVGLDPLIDADKYGDVVDRIDNGTLWSVRQGLRAELIDFCHNRVARRARRVGGEPAQLDLRKDALTIGFARRFATYKRANLLFWDIDRLVSILDQAPGHVQFVFAGKAHPADHGGKELIQKVYWGSQDPRIKGRILLLEDYDMSIGRALVKGVDVWLNNPRRPKEASGTSGMKSAMNGGLNLSILDGWWPEGYNEENGWVIGDESPKGSVHAQDEFDAQCLYSMLEEFVIPTFYHRDDDGIPQQWVGKMKSAVRSVTPQFASDRQVKDYIQTLYAPAASA
ncbi:MAG: alpha-glucan family phosphorylase [Myxococcota bacterium]|nr:alpha-glucan family phosphorylase [Myxococcota bacterium]